MGSPDRVLGKATGTSLARSSGIEWGQVLGKSFVEIIVITIGANECTLTSDTA